MTEARWVTLYDAERHFLTGGQDSYRHVKVNYNTYDEFLKIQEDLRDEQKEINREFKLKQKNLKILPGRVEMLERRDEAPKMILQSDVNLELDRGTGNTLLLLGASKQGKSTLMMHLYRKYYNTPAWISTLFTINTQVGAYKDTDGKDLLITVPTFNAEAQEMVKKAKALNTRVDNKYDFLFMFDDIIDQKYNKLISQLFLTYRNANISTIISLQYGYLLSKQARSNVNNVCLFRFLSDESIEAVVSTYLQGWFRKIGVRSKEDQIVLYKELTVDHQFLYLNPRTDEVTLHKLRHV